MKAAQYVAPGHIDLVEKAAPQRNADQILVQVEKVAICGSDLHLAYEALPESYPYQPGYSGHECVGVIAESDMPEFAPGHRVLVIPPDADVWTEYLALDPCWLIPIPDRVTSAHAILAQLLGCVIYACKKLDNVLGKTAVVVGQGPAGMLFTVMLRQLGVKQIIGLDIVDYRLEVAAGMGADVTLIVDGVHPTEAVRDLTHGQMADIVIEAVGKEETINLCPDLAREFGELSLFGGPARQRISFAYERFLRKQLRTTTTAHTQRETGLKSFRLAMELIDSGRVDVAPLVTHQIPLQDIQRGFDLAFNRQDGAVKVLVNML